MEAAIAAFVEGEIADFAVYLADLAKQRIVARRIVVDQDLLNSLSVQASKSQFEVWFKDHGRMHDMGAGNGYQKGKFMGTEERGRVLKGRKPSYWYSRLMWGAVYGTLVNNLANKYVAEMPRLLTGEFNKA